jgi:hypothetical protein
MTPNNNFIEFWFFKPKWYEIIAYMINIKTNSEYHHCGLKIGKNFYEAKLTKGVIKSSKNFYKSDYVIKMPLNFNSKNGKIFIKHVES